MQDKQGITKRATDRMLSWMKILNTKSRNGIPKDQNLAVLMQGRGSWDLILLWAEMADVIWWIVLIGMILILSGAWHKQADTVFQGL